MQKTQSSWRPSQMGKLFGLALLFLFGSCQPMPKSNPNTNANANANSQTNTGSVNANSGNADRGVAINTREPEK